MPVASIDFDLPAEFELTRTSARRAVSSAPEMGVRRARQIAERQIRTFQLKWKNAGEGIFRRLDLLWAATKGNVVPMNFTPPGESQIEVRFAAPDIAYNRVSVFGGELALELEEVL